ncbi:MAG: hypothetical protein RR343_05470 [Oscillospiraceae bacterium]
MSRILSKAFSIVLALVLSISLSIEVFAVGIVDIAIDGTIYRPEWGDNANKIPITNTQSIDGVQKADFFVLTDTATSEICIGIKIIETIDPSDNSAIKIHIGNEYNLKLCKNGINTESHPYLKESAKNDSVQMQYMIETKIIYPGLKKNTPISISIINSSGVESQTLALDIENKTVGPQPITKPSPTTTASSTTTKPDTTTPKDQQQSSTKHSQTSAEKETKAATLKKHSTSSKANNKNTTHKKAISATAESFENNADATVVTVNQKDQEVPLAEVANAQNDVFENKTKENKTNKIAIITVAGVLVSVAVALPVLKNIKSKNTTED